MKISDSKPIWNYYERTYEEDQVMYASTFLRLAFICVIMSSAVLLTGSSVGAADDTLRHFYVYDECHVPIVVTVSYIPLNQEKAITEDVAVSPGHQTLILTTYKAAVSTHSNSKDGILRWTAQNFDLSNAEYTHVIACRCKQTESGCQDPELWPHAESRQFPDSK
ncbi:hypothetical protein [Tunturiibacter gelidoferens]|uniref:Uncharacterized protein n=1 Tax=Tunturiibacter gelidiferens TaxID=3069689 RepID=A0ACC5P598_9BACT|nr:hypothetical protein [Edaphobacter lichenicola]MBB5342002.1 hypothetical protein [Edaphobacter lichenicola]